MNVHVVIPHHKFRFVILNKSIIPYFGLNINSFRHNNTAISVFICSFESAHSAHIYNFGHNKRAAVGNPFESYFFCFSFSDFRISSIFDSLATVGYSFSKPTKISFDSVSSFLTEV